MVSFARCFSMFFTFLLYFWRKCLSKFWFWGLVWPTEVPFCWGIFAFTGPVTPRPGAHPLPRQLCLKSRLLGAFLSFFLSGLSSLGIFFCFFPPDRFSQFGSVVFFFSWAVGVPFDLGFGAKNHTYLKASPEGERQSTSQLLVLMFLERLQTTN